MQRSDTQNKRFALLSSGICKYSYFGKRSSSVSVSSKSIVNLRKLVISKSLSKSSSKKVKEIITNWIIGIKLTQKQQYGTKQKFSNYLVLITLTLPSKQVESDKVMKSKYLNIFLTKMRYHTANFNYLWVSERQKNGNIHFHLIVDKWFNQIDIQKLWNDTLSNGCYIDEFQKKHGHRNPPSTHICGQNKMKDVGNYLTQYVTKSEKSDVIEGKVWDCSVNLLKIRKMVFSWKEYYYELIKCDFYKLRMKFIESDFRELFLFRKHFIESFLKSELFFEIEHLIKQHLSVIFPSLIPQNPLKNLHPIPLAYNQLRLDF